MRHWRTCAHHGVLFLDEFWFTRRSLVAVDDALDVAEVAAAITRARQELTKNRVIRGCHSSIKNKADEARRHVAALVDVVDQAISALREILLVDRLSRGLACG